MNAPPDDFAEGVLYFHLPPDRAKRFDRKGEDQPDGWKRVDFLVRERENLLLIEVKAPNHPHATQEARTAFNQELHKGLINNKVVPKARDTFCFLYLMARDDQEMDFVLVIDSDELKSDHARILALQRKLVERLKKESPEPWRRPYIRNAWVMVPEDFQRKFGYQVTDGSTG